MTPDQTLPAKLYLGVWLGEGGRDREEELLLGAHKECAEPARLSPATSALIAPPPLHKKQNRNLAHCLMTLCFRPTNSYSQGE